MQKEAWYGLVHTSSFVLLLDKALRTRGAAFKHFFSFLAYSGIGGWREDWAEYIVLKFKCIVDVYFSFVVGLDCHCVFPTRLHSLWSTWWTTTVTCEAASSFSGSETVKLQCKCFARKLFGLQLHHLQLLLITTDQRQIMTWFNLLGDKIQNYGIKLWFVL